MTFILDSTFLGPALLPFSQPTYIKLRDILFQFQPRHIPDDGKGDDTEHYATRDPGAVGLREGKHIKEVSLMQHMQGGREEMNRRAVNLPV